jgi:uncharacterized membrane protein YGL010W
MRRVDQWLVAYGQSHQNAVNKRLHWICVPMIVWCVIALLWCVPTGLGSHRAINWGTGATLAALAYYAALSPRLALGAVMLLGAMIASIELVWSLGAGIQWRIATALFVLAWMGQFVGHRIEGKRPSFFQDLQFLLIGPLWLLADSYRRLGLKY